MGMLRDIVRAIINDPLIPREKRACKQSGISIAVSRRAVTRQSFCDRSSSKPCVTVCRARRGCACDCRSLKAALVEELSRRKMNITVGDMKLGCAGPCKNGPMIGFPQKGFWYVRVKIDQVPEIVEETLVHGRILHDRLSLSPDRSCRSDVYFERDTGLIGVIDDQTSMVEVAKYFMEFGRGLSCGKCTPCRIGLKRMEEGLERVVAGRGTTEDLEQIKNLCRMMKETPYCDFAMANSLPIFSALGYFEEEFRAVVKEVPPEPVEEPAEKTRKKTGMVSPVRPSEPVAAAKAVEPAVSAPEAEPVEAVAAKAESAAEAVLEIVAEVPVVTEAPVVEPVAPAVVLEEPPVKVEEPVQVAEASETKEEVEGPAVAEMPVVVVEKAVIASVEAAAPVEFEVEAAPAAEAPALEVIEEPLVKVEEAVHGAEVTGAGEHIEAEVVQEVMEEPAPVAMLAAVVDIKAPAEPVAAVEVKAVATVAEPVVEEAVGAVPVPEDVALETTTTAAVVEEPTVVLEEPVQVAVEVAAEAAPAKEEAPAVPPKKRAASKTQATKTKAKTEKTTKAKKKGSTVSKKGKK